MPRNSRKVKPAERSYLLTGIPASLWDEVTAKAAQAHHATCGDGVSHERCPVHALKPTLLTLLLRWARDS